MMPYKSEKMTSMNSNARLAGSLYLVLIITGAFSIIYIPSTLIVWSDASATVSNISNSEFLFRLGIVSGLISNVIFLVLPFVLYRLLKPVNKTMAGLMALLAVISIPLGLIGLSNLFDVLTLLGSSDYLNMLEAEQLQIQVMLSLASYNNGLHVATVFWGLWLFPFGYLVYKSGFLPRILGIFLMAGCFGYLIEFFALSLWPISYRATGISTFIHIPSAIGEIGTLGFNREVQHH